MFSGASVNSSPRLRALQRHEPAEQLHGARAAGRVEHERLRLQLLQLRRCGCGLVRHLRAVRARVPRLVELLLALRAELLLEDPEALRADRRVRIRTSTWHLRRAHGAPGDPPGIRGIPGAPGIPGAWHRAARHCCLLHLCAPCCACPNCCCGGCRLAAAADTPAADTRLVAAGYLAAAGGTPAAARLTRLTRRGIELCVVVLLRSPATCLPCPERLRAIDVHLKLPLIVWTPMLLF